MRYENQPVYMIGIAAKLCNVHPQTLRQYERIGLVIPARVGAKNRLYSERDIHRVRRIQRLTQGLGVNLAGVEIILRLLDQMEETRQDFERHLATRTRAARLPQIPPLSTWLPPSLIEGKHHVGAAEPCP